MSFCKRGRDEQTGWKETRCPICGNHTGFEIDSMGSYICDNCGALFVHSPFGPQFITKDARERHPHFAGYPVKAWNPEKWNELYGDKPQDIISPSSSNSTDRLTLWQRFKAFVKSKRVDDE